MKKKLIIFTRYPVAGSAKTRLIPVLGPEGASDLQQEMTARTIHTADSLAEGYRLAVEIRHEGGSSGQMGKWLGTDRVYCEQGLGDLGKKMSRALTEAFLKGYEQVMIIGTDCPGLSPEILKTAFTSLADHNLVLGPATDGGYYLIGLNRPCPELFHGRSWGGNLLLSETLAAARKLALTFHLLEELPDVDRPEDLVHFDNYPHPE